MPRGRIVLVAPPKLNARPLCPGCGVRLQPYMVTIEYGVHIGKGSPDKVRWDGGWHAYGAFCTMRCAVGYANYVFNKHAIRLGRQA